MFYYVILYSYIIVLNYFVLKVFATEENCLVDLLIGINVSFLLLISLFLKKYPITQNSFNFSIKKFMKNLNDFFPHLIKSFWIECQSHQSLIQLFYIFLTTERFKP